VSEEAGQEGFNQFLKTFLELYDTTEFASDDKNVYLKKDFPKKQ